MNSFETPIDDKCLALQQALVDIAFSRAGLGRDLLVGFASYLVESIRINGGSGFQEEQLHQIETELGLILPLQFA